MVAPGVLMGAGIPAAPANLLGLAPNTITGIGTALAGGAPITTHLTLTTTAGGTTAFVLPSVIAGAGPFWVVNPSSTTALVFPNTASETIQGGGAGGSFSVAQNKAAAFVKTGSTTWAAILTA